jgi:hypothetical protein
MSIKTMMRVWEHSQMRGAARCLLLALADFANDDGICWPGTANLAAKIRESDDYTATLIKKCIDAGELAHAAGRGRGHKTRFAVLCGLDTKAQNHLKGALQKGYSSTPFTKGVSQSPFSEKRGTTKGVLESGKRGTFPDTKHPLFTAAERGETTIDEKLIHHDPGDHDHTHERSVPTSPPTRAPERTGGDGDGRTLAFLESEGIGAASEFAHLPYEATRRDYAARIAAGQTRAIIVKAWRRDPPTEESDYGRRSLQGDHAPNRPGRSAVAAPRRSSDNPTGGLALRDPTYYERELAKLGAASEEPTELPDL